jgi:N-acetylmuramoyl-L-alanine amidase
MVPALRVLLLLSLGLLACQRQRDQGAPTDHVAWQPPWGTGPLPSRTEVVAEADRLAVSGVQRGGEQGLRDVVQAAELREQIWRLEGRESDVLEAIELRAVARKLEGRKGCEHELRATLLRGEHTANAKELFENVYLLREVHRDDRSCVEQTSRALSTLEAFRATPDRLAQLDEQARRERGQAQGQPSSAPSSAATPKAVGKVVVPPQKSIEFAGTSRITQIERYPGKEAARIVVFMTAPASFQVGQLAAEPPAARPRLFVDIPAASYAGANQFDVGGIVERVRVGKQVAGTRVVLDLADAVSEQVFYLPEPFRLVIDVVRASSGQAPRKKDREIQRVVLDPGHGGHDPGATGLQGLREKDVVLDIAHRAAPLIARELGISTLLTRDLDAFVPLDERVARANAFAADLFISIHCNANEAHSGRGVMTFILDNAGDASAATVAARENAASLAASAELASAIGQMADARVAASSLHFAELVQKASISAMQPRYPDIRDGGVHRAGFYVLAGARMPAVLFEASFISHPIDEQRLNTPDYRQKLADGLVNAIRAYREGL